MEPERQHILTPEQRKEVVAFAREASPTPRDAGKRRRYIHKMGIIP